MRRHSQSTKRVRVDFIYPMPRKGELVVHLEPSEWHNSDLGWIDLCLSNRRVPMMCFGYGSAKPISGEQCMPYLILRPTDTTGMTVQQIKDAFDASMPEEGRFIEKVAGL